jgi:hypothetical protein
MKTHVKSLELYISASRRYTKEHKKKESTTSHNHFYSQHNYYD